MAEKLIVLSDMWGIKKGLWITSYFGYLQQYYDIEFHDVQQLANLDIPVLTGENIHKAFVEGGIDTAVAHLLKKVDQPCHVLAFSTGGTIAWKAGVQGLPMKSLTAISPTRIRFEENRPDCTVDLIYGECDAFKPDMNWAKKVGIDFKIVPNFGHELYSDEKIIGDVSMDMLNKVTRKAV